VRRQLVLALLLLSTVGFAQTNVHLEFESASVRKGWVATSASKAPPTDAQTWDGKSGDIKLPPSDKLASSNLFVLDTATGNLASKPLSDASKGPRRAYRPLT